MTVRTSRLTIVHLTADPPAAGPPLGPPPPEFLETLAYQVMGWHRFDLNEGHIEQAVTRTAATLIPGAVGAVILVLSAPGELAIRAAHGLLPEILGGDTSMSGQPQRRRFLRTPLHTEGLLALHPSTWPVFTIPAGRFGGDEVICAPLGSGHTMFGTLAVAAHPSEFGQPAIGKVTAVAMHASTALAAARIRTSGQNHPMINDAMAGSTGM